jgi:hypothetical protein
MPDADPSSSTKAVFLSYSSDDTAVALAVCEALREAGVEVWMDRSELQGGDAWDANIQRQIRECALIIPIISKRTQARREGYFRLEWRLADERMRLVAEGTPLILPVAADETREQDALVPKSFLSVQWPRLPHGHVPPAFVARVKKLLGQESVVVMNSVPAIGTPPTMTADSLVTSNAAAAEPPMRVANDAPTSSRRSIWPIAAAAVLALLFGVVGTWFLKSPKNGPQGDSKPVGRFTHALPAGVTFRNPGRPVVAISPDGRPFVYNTTAGLFLRKWDELEARIIPGTEAALTTNPVFSPDGQSLVFFSGNDLRKIAVSGGASVSLASIKEIFGINWGSDGTIVFGLQDGIWRVAAMGRAPERIIPAADGETLSQPQILPDGESVLFSSRQASGVSQVEVGFLESGERTIVVPGGGSGRFLPATGHLLYLIDRDLYGVAFDLLHRATRGVAVLLIQGVRVSVFNLAHLTVSDDGTLLYVMGEDTLTIPVWVDRQATEEPLKNRPGQLRQFHAFAGCQQDGDWILASFHRKQVARVGFRRGNADPSHARRKRRQTSSLESGRQSNHLR